MGSANIFYVGQHSEVPYLKTLVTLGGPVFKAGLVLILVPNLRDLGPITPQIACPVLTRQQGGSPSHGNASALSKECCAALLSLDLNFFLPLRCKNLTLFSELLMQYHLNSEYRISHIMSLPISWCQESIFEACLQCKLTALCSEGVAVAFKKRLVGGSLELSTPHTTYHITHFRPSVSSWKAVAAEGKAPKLVPSCCSRHQAGRSLLIRKGGRLPEPKQGLFNEKGYKYLPFPSYRLH